LSYEPNDEREGRDPKPKGKEKGKEERK